MQALFQKSSKYKTLAKRIKNRYLDGKYLNIKYLYKPDCSQHYVNFTKYWNRFRQSGSLFYYSRRVSLAANLARHADDMHAFEFGHLLKAALGETIRSFTGWKVFFARNFDNFLERAVNASASFSAFSR